MDRDSAREAPSGLFAGLSTLDIIQRVDQPPARNAKVTALRQDVAGGGPALNAAVVFAALGGRATLLTRLGGSNIARLIRDDIESRGVVVADCADAGYVPSVSALTVDDATGDRQIVSTDAHDRGEALPGSGRAVQRWLATQLRASQSVDIVHVDGHHPDLALAAARWGVRIGVPSVLDAGRWKPVMRHLVELATDVVCSADFTAPDEPNLMAWLRAHGVARAVITHGSAPVVWATASGQGIVETERVVVVDTVGAGDFFHGAYSFARAMHRHRGRVSELSADLAFAAHLAALSCTRFGTRSWLDAVATVEPADLLGGDQP